MYAIPNPTWNGIKVYTWAELSQHQWDCLRKPPVIVNEVITEQQVSGGVIVNGTAIMESQTEMIVSIIVSERDYLKDLLKYLPLYERTSSVFYEVLKSYDLELRNVEQLLEVFKRNTFISTAIELLPTYERDIGIGGAEILNYQQRREQIIARNIASFGQTTEETIKAVAIAFSAGEVEVNRTTRPGVYEIKFVGVKGEPKNMAGLIKALDIVAPAHLQFEYTYTYNEWQAFAGEKWGEVAHLTWTEITVWEGVN